MLWLEVVTVLWIWMDGDGERGTTKEVSISSRTAFTYLLHTFSCLSHLILSLLLDLIAGGVQTKTAMAIMNCIQARDSCMNNTACHPILEVVPRVCGAEKGEGESYDGCGGGQRSRPCSPACRCSGAGLKYGKITDCHA